MTGRLRGRVWLSIAEASEASGIPESTLRTQCRDSRRRCRKVGKGRGRWQVLASSFAHRERG
jgi:DNA-directed RNA polymerase specialized sigma24 family protein